MSIFTKIGGLGKATRTDFDPRSDIPASDVQGAIEYLRATIAALSTVYQPLDSDLTAIAALTTTSYGRSLLGLANATALAGEISSFYQPIDADLTAIAALTTSSFGRSLLTLANAAAAFDALSPTTTRGDIIFRNASTNTRLAAGTAGYMLQTNGAAADPSYAGFLQAGTGAATRTWQNKDRDVFSLKDFGAVGDGSTDDTTALTNAIAAALAANRALCVPAGSYRIVGNITVNMTAIPTQGFQMYGEGRNTSKLSFDSGYGFAIESASDNVFGRIAHMHFSGTNSGTFMRIGKTDLSDPFNEFILDDLWVTNASTAGTAIALQLNFFVNGYVNCVVNGGGYNVGGFTGSGFAALDLHQVIMTTFLGSYGLSGVGTMIRDGSNYGNVFINTDNEACTTCIQINDSTVHDNTWIGGTVALGNTGLYAVAGSANVFKNTYINVPSLNSPIGSAVGLHLETPGYAGVTSLAAAATLVLGATTKDVIDVTGNTGISAVTLAEGQTRTIRFTGNPLLTNGASFVLLGGANIQAKAGDYAVLRGYGSSVVRLMAYGKANGAPTVGRELLMANRTYYVRTDGSDANDGLTNSAGGAKLTIQAAIDVVVGLDLGIYDVLIDVISNATYAPFTLKKLIGAGVAVIRGDASTPANMTIDGGSSQCVTADGVVRWEVDGFKFTSTNANGMIVADNFSSLKVRNFNFGASSGSSVVASNGAVIELLGTAAISGNTTNYILYAHDGGTITTRSQTWTCTGTPTFTYFAIAYLKAFIVATAATTSGACTGTRYLVIYSSVLHTGGGSTSLPGTGGTVDAASYSVLT